MLFSLFRCVEYTCSDYLTLVQTVAKSSLILVLQLLDLLLSLEIEREDSKEEEEITLPTFVEARTEPSEEQSSFIVVAGVLIELAPEEEVAESTSEPDNEPVKAWSFEFEPNKEGKLPIEEVAPVE